MKTSSAGIELIKDFEGFREEAYQCSAGVWTYGYGSTRTIAGKRVTQGMNITQAAAEMLLKSEVSQFETQVNRLVQVPLTQNQFDSLVSFTYNTGGAALEGSTLLAKLNAGDYAGAAKQFNKWIYATDAKTGKKRKVQGLINRRKAEAELFLQQCGEPWTYLEKKKLVPRDGNKYGWTYAPNSNNTPLRNRDLPLPSGKLAIETRGVQPSDAIIVGTAGIATTSTAATLLTDPQIITSSLSFLQSVDWRVGLAVVVIGGAALLWIRGRK